MTQTIIADSLRAGQTLTNYMNVDAFAADMTLRGEKVALFRDYVAGNQRNFLTDRMRAQLNLPPAPASSQGAGDTTGASFFGRRKRSNATQQARESTAHDFSANYCSKVVQTMSARLDADDITVTGASEGDSEALAAWLDGLRDANNFDSLQTQTYDAALGDGSVFVMADWDTANERVNWTVEPAYDGTDGVVAITDARGNVQVAIKIWRKASEGAILDTDRINVYYPNRIERYIRKDAGGLMQFVPEGESSHILPWPEEIGIPVVPFINRRKAYTTDGKSEIEDVIPLQDGLNRSMYSLVATAENTGFGIGFATGCEVPTVLQPGTVIEVSAGPDGGQPLTATDDSGVSYHEPKFQRIKGELPTAFVDTANWFVEQISIVSDTPIPALMGSDASSGEALKQRESGLLAKVKRAQIEFGNAWERVVRISHAITVWMGATLPPIVQVSVRWTSAEIRSENTVVTLLIQLQQAGIVDQRTVLEAAAFAFNWSATDIDAIIQRTEESALNRSNALITAGFNGFGEFGL